ncbi:RNA-binding protein 34 isoform 2-T2 [Salvelinus alpinus]
MKNTLSGESEEGPSVDKQSMDYVVGSVSGSLFPMESASSSGSLSALFQAAPAVDTLFFVPAPKPELRSVELKEGTVTKVSNNQKQTKKAAKDKSAADLSLENRESALQNAYKAEQVPKMPKKTKRKAVEMGEGSAKEEERQTKKTEDWIPNCRGEGKAETNSVCRQPSCQLHKEDTTARLQGSGSQ